MNDDADNNPPADGAIYHCEIFSNTEDLTSKLEDSLFRYCLFLELAPFGGIATSEFVSTSFVNVDWYSGLFNVCNFLDCQFEGCTFRGTSFPDCRFVDCRFSDCRLLADNLGGECVFDGAKWYGCLQSGCEGLPAVVPKLEEGQGKTGRQSRL
jgi:uncharacterized protein YjbI with pentapeptide repeats